MANVTRAIVGMRHVVEMGCSVLFFIGLILPAAAQERVAPLDILLGVDTESDSRIRLLNSAAAQGRGIELGSDGIILRRVNGDADSQPAGIAVAAKSSSHFAFQLDFSCGKLKNANAKGPNGLVIQFCSETGEIGTSVGYVLTRRQRNRGVAVWDDRHPKGVSRMVPLELNTASLLVQREERKLTISISESVSPTSFRKIMTVPVPSDPIGEIRILCIGNVDAEFELHHVFFAGDTYYDQPQPKSSSWSIRYLAGTLALAVAAMAFIWYFGAKSILQRFR